MNSMYVDSSACVRIKWDESEQLRIDSGVRQRSIMSHWLFNVYMDAMMKMRMGRRGVRFLEDRRDGRLPGLLYAGDLVLWGELEEDLRVMLGWFAEVCSRRGMKVNAGKSKGMVLNGEECLECEMYADGIHLEHVSEFKYVGCFG